MKVIYRMSAKEKLRDEIVKAQAEAKRLGKTIERYTISKAEATDLARECNWSLRILEAYGWSMFFVNCGRVVIYLEDTPEAPQ